MRIASLSPAITEILFLLGVEEQIVCTDQFSDYPPAARKIPHLKDHQAIDVRTLREFNAQLIFTSTVIQERLAGELQSDDMSAMHFDPRTLNGVYDVIRQLGVLLEVEPKAAALIRQMQEEFNTVKRKAALLPRKPRIYVEEWHHPPFASANWVPEIVRLAGGEQIPQARGGELSPQVRLGQVQAWDPELIILSWCGAGLSIDAKAIFATREGWQNLSAVKAGHVYVIDDSFLNRHGPRLVEGARRLYGWMFEILH